jgi:uncharacterized DUF497 family protein
MTATQMIELMNRKPFDAFEVHLADGANIKVEEPWKISTSRKSLVCVIFDAEERMRIISFRNITEVVTRAVQA